ncbi:MAG TPA: hypothetical protein PKY77_27050 [Phycisphaerae bacterium]|jgi:hypothetical protein|nr:hypothetical protein [Phycisphaerae bacterium]
MSGYTSPAIADIDSRWIDPNLENAAADFGRMLGWNPMTASQINKLYADGVVTDFPSSELIPETEWDDIIKRHDAQGGWLERRLIEIKDQDGEGSCVANAATSAHQIIQGMHWGDHNVRILSAISVYRECAPGPNTGSNVGDVMRQMIDTGAIPSDKGPLAKADVAAGFYRDVHPDCGYRVKPASGWEQKTACFFRVDEWWRLPTLKAIFSANAKGLPVVGARQSHCMVFGRWFLKNGKRLFCHFNSWGQSYGEKLQISTGMAGGFGFDSESTVAAWASREAWAPRTIVKPSWLKV